MAGKAPICFFQQIDLPPGQLLIPVGVLDYTSNKVRTLEPPLKAGEKWLGGIGRRKLVA